MTVYDQLCVTSYSCINWLKSVLCDDLIFVASCVKPCNC
jgi:hypothetical protein